MIALPNYFNWTIAKTDLSRLTGLSDDALHVLSGMLILTLAALILRRPPWSWRPWLVTAIAETINELYDLTQTWFPSDEGNLRASSHDFWLTLAGPTLILLVYPYFVRLEHEGGMLAPLRRVWHLREFRIGFVAAALIGILASYYFW
jgi:hypothetical protein